MAYSYKYSKKIRRVCDRADYMTSSTAQYQQHCTSVRIPTRTMRDFDEGQTDGEREEDRGRVDMMVAACCNCLCFCFLLWPCNNIYMAFLSRHMHFYFIFLTHKIWNLKANEKFLYVFSIIAMRCLITAWTAKIILYFVIGHGLLNCPFVFPCIHT